MIHIVLGENPQEGEEEEKRIVEGKGKWSKGRERGEGHGAEPEERWLRPDGVRGGWGASLSFPSSSRSLYHLLSVQNSDHVHLPPLPRPLHRCPPQPVQQLHISSSPLNRI